MALFGKGIDKPQTNEELDADRRGRERVFRGGRAADRRAAREHNPDLRTNADIRKLHGK